eukprot:scaffold236_cov419-Prasinococcus_capsulatus_cf.AAC.27
MSRKVRREHCGLQLQLRVHVVHPHRTAPPRGREHLVQRGPHRREGLCCLFAARAEGATYT